MGIVKRELDDWTGYADMQVDVLKILNEYDYHVADLRYIEDNKQLVVTMLGIVMFVQEEDISISFEISTPPDVASNFILILAEKIYATKIHLTENFYITTGLDGKKMALFGPDATYMFNKEFTGETVEEKKYTQILTSDKVKFYKC